MKFGIMVNRKMIDRTSSDPCGRLYSCLNEMEDLGGVDKLAGAGRPAIRI